MSRIWTIKKNINKSIMITETRRKAITKILPSSQFVLDKKNVSPVFLNNPVDFSEKSSLSLYKNFLSLMIDISFYSLNILDYSFDEYINKKSLNVQFFEKTKITNFIDVAKKIILAINTYEYVKNPFNKKLYLNKIKNLSNTLFYLFNFLFEFFGSITNTFIYRNSKVKERVISIVNPRLNYEQKHATTFLFTKINIFFNSIYNILISNFSLEDNIYGFIKGKSCIDNANYHLSNNPESLINIDINKFFNNCSLLKIIKSNIFFDIYSFFKMPQFLHRSLCLGTYALLSFCTHNSIFPTGSSFTPVLSNIYMFFADIKIKQYLQSLSNCNVNILYSRYVDDITISSNIQKLNNKNILSIETINHIEEIIRPYGLYVKYKKTTIAGKGDKKMVNNIILDLNNNKLSIGSKKKKVLRHFMDTATDISPSMRGYLSYVSSIHSDEYNYITRNK